MSKNKTNGLKNSYELAMERMSARTGASNPLTNTQKAAIAEIENIMKARVAELEILFAQKKTKAMGDMDALAKLQSEFSAQTEKIRSRADSEKETVRKGI